MESSYEPGDVTPPSHLESGEGVRLDEASAYFDVEPESGREVIVIGDPVGCRDFNHRQGDNPFGFTGTCGLVSCEDILRQFGLGVTEADVVRFAIEAGLCNTYGKSDSCGGTSESSQARLLTDFGVPAGAYSGLGPDDLAEVLREGRGVIVGVNAGVLWDDVRCVGDDPGLANHAIVVTGAALDATTLEVTGFYVNDSGRNDSGRFIPIELMREAWQDAGGLGVVTDVVRPGFAPR